MLFDTHYTTFLLYKRMHNVANWMKYVLFSSFLTFGVFVSTSFAFEITRVPLSPGNDFIVSPTHFDFDLTEKRTMARDMVVVNRSSSVVDFEVGAVELGNGVASAHKWMFPEIPLFTLRPNEKIVFDFTVRAPQDVSDGLYYANIVVSGKPRDVMGVQIISRVVAPVFVVIDTQHILRPSGKVTNILVPLIQESPNISFEIFYKNSGNTYMKQEGSILVQNLLNRRVARENISSFYILPGEEKKLVIPHTVNGVGLYRARVALGGEPSVTKYFFIVPLRALFTIVLLGFLIVGIRTLWIK